MQNTFLAAHPYTVVTVLAKPVDRSSLQPLLFKLFAVSAIYNTAAAVVASSSTAANFFFSQQCGPRKRVDVRRTAGVDF